MQRQLQRTESLPELLEAAWAAALPGRETVERRASRADPFLVQSTDRIIALAAQHRIPAVYATSESVVAGLISYRTSISNAWRLARPAELLVVQPTEFELVLNL